ncbi:MAG: hypothetical protein ACLVKO_09160 [Dysgonomonas sp.]
MKKLIILFLLTITCLRISAQDCKYVVNKFDRELNRLVETEEKRINKSFTSRYYFAMSFTITNTLKTMGLKIVGGTSTLRVRDNDKLILTLNNNETITLYPLKEILSSTVSFSNLPSYSYALPHYYLCDNYLDKISETGLKKISMYTSERLFESEVKEKDNKNIKQLIRCVK